MVYLRFSNSNKYPLYDIVLFNLMFNKSDLQISLILNTNIVYAKPLIFGQFKQHWNHTKRKTSLTKLHAMTNMVLPWPPQLYSQHSSFLPVSVGCAVRPHPGTWQIILDTDLKIHPFFVFTNPFVTQISMCIITIISPQKLLNCKWM